jgi:SpoVK/Ycf46/Vps4 family AAA+-type ATPase
VFRRFDDVITYGLPSPEIARGILESHLTGFELNDLDWTQILEATSGLSQAEVSRAADEAAKVAVLSDADRIRTSTLLSTLAERRAATS